MSDIVASFPRGVAAASTLFVLAMASVAGVLQAGRGQPDPDGNMAVQEFLTSGPTGVRTWEVFVGRQGAVCGCTVAPGLEPQNFVMRYSPAKVALQDGSAEFLELWSTLCATPGTPKQRSKSKLFAETGDKHGHE